MATTEVKTDIKVNINGRDIVGQKGQTILEVARKNSIHIPTLCHHSDLCLKGVCRICICEIEGQRLLQASCSTPIAEGMVIKTNSRKVRKARKMIVELLLANHYGECTTCKRNLNCELQALADEYGVDELRFPKIKEPRYEIKEETPIVRDNDKCILCRRCVNVCEEIQGVEAIKALYRGANSEIGSMYNLDLGEVVCVMCGQCINRCPTGALSEKDATRDVWNAIDDPTKHVIVQTAPAIRATVAELFNIPPGSRITGKLVTALKKMGFDSVLDTDFTADLTIMEEGTELLTRLKKALFYKEDVALPMTTSCSPGWIKYIEHYYPDLLANVSSCKSPQQMFGALAKTYYAEKKGINPEDIVTVSVMPCTAKKYEADRPEMYDSGFKDVDFVLTNRELGKMVKEAGMNIMELEESTYDSLMGDST
ncbi:MAG: [Fe-Fe] hydrogenase large subunit C-terminal domain-containing protein, partial [Vampirovibrionia bacterium]